MNHKILGAKKRNQPKKCIHDVKLSKILIIVVPLLPFP